MSSSQYLVYTPRLPNGPISKHKTLGEAALAMASNLFISETGFVIHKNNVVLAFTKPNTLIQPTPNVAPTPQPFPWPIQPSTLPQLTCCNRIHKS